MENQEHVLVFLLIAILFTGHTHCEDVILMDNGPVVLGANITLTAKVYTTDGELAWGRFVYEWNDNASPAHSFKEESDSPISQWNISYPSSVYHPKIYQVEVYVKKKGFIFNSNFKPVKRDIQITDLLNGELQLNQNVTGRMSSNLVASKVPVIHKVSLKQPDLDFLSSATHLSTYWFIDCVYYGQSGDFEFNYTFKDVGMNHNIEALVIASFDKPTPSASTTTVAPATTTTTPKPVASNSTSPIPHPVTSSQNQLTANPAAQLVNPTDITATSNTSIESNASIPTANVPGLKPPPFNISEFICLNTSIVPRDLNKTYGHFSKKLGVRARVENLTYTGTNWLQLGDIVDLQVYYNGSGIFHWCTYEEVQDYHVIGNETCFSAWQTENCSFPVTHFASNNVTLVIIVSNDVSTGVLGVKINLYSVQRRAQLSVIVVPITCSMIVVVLIVFGIAYYVQSRARFTVEIADFDFGQSDDLEYKTFRERLFDAVNNAVNRVEVLDEENTSAGPSNKYVSLP